MEKVKKIMLLLVVMFITSACGKTEKYTIHEPCKYPVEVGSKEWNDMTDEEREDAIQIDTEIIKSFTP